MDKARTKLFALLLLVLALIVSACTSGGSSGGETQQPGSGQQQETSSGSNNESASSADGEDLPHLELNWFVSSPADAILPEGDLDFIGKTIEEKFNVTLNIEYLPLGPDFDNRLNLRLASDDVPDLFITTGINSQTYIRDGMAADLDDYINPENTPNYFRWVSEVELERYSVEGVFQRAPVVFPRQVYRSYYVRKDWIDALNEKDPSLNLKVPSNYDEMMAVMRAFTFNDPDGNGVNDTYGFSAVGNGTSVSLDFPDWIHNGLVGSFMIRDNELVDVQSDLAVQHVLQGIKDKMAEGIVDPEWFLLQGTQHVDKAIAGRVGIVAAGQKDFAFDSNPNSIQNRSKAVNPNAEWVPFHPFPENAWTETLPETPFLFGKNTEPEKMERMAQIIDWMVSEEGFLLIVYGQEGKHYTRDGNTITITQEHLEAYNTDVVQQGNFAAIYQFIYAHNPEFEPLGLEVIDERMSDRDREIVATIQSYKLIPSIGTNVAPPPGFNLADFRRQMREFHVQILFDEPDASNWPKYRERLMTEFGGQEMLDAYTEQIRAAGVIK